MAAERSWRRRRMPSPKVPSQGSTSLSALQSFDIAVNSVQGASSCTERLWIINLASLQPYLVRLLLVVGSNHLKSETKYPYEVVGLGGRRCQLMPKWLASISRSLRRTDSTDHKDYTVGASRRTSRLDKMHS